uniref:Uncharacterized protein n=1 Tax=Acrobeloides nanus TaxID=290746 RepID=A0A914DWN1_9BILA
MVTEQCEKRAMELDGEPIEFVKKEDDLLPGSASKISKTYSKKFKIQRLEPTCSTSPFFLLSTTEVRRRHSETPTQRSSRQRNGPWNAKSSVFDSSIKSSPTRFANRRCSSTLPRMHANASSGGPGTLRDDKTTAGPREQPSGGPTISSDLLDYHHTMETRNGTSHWSKLAQYRQKSRRIQKAAEGSASNQWLNRIFKYQAWEQFLQSATPLV